MAKDQCAKWFHYIQNPLPKKEPRLRQKGLTQKQTYTQRARAHAHTHTYRSEVMYDHISEQQKIDYPYHTV